MLIAFLVNTLLITLVVLTHYEALFRLSSIIPKIPIANRFRVLAGIFGALIAHIFEVWLFAIAYFALSQIKGFGELRGEFTGSLLDCAYFSFATYTSLGIGDIIPTGNFRFLVGLEALTGLVLITWTASYLFLEMRTYWKNT